MTRAVGRTPNLDAYDNVRVTAADRIRDRAMVKMVMRQCSRASW